MKNLVKLYGFTSIFAIIGAIFTACSEPGSDSGPTALEGTVSITGIAEVGQTLTADASTLGATLD